MSEQIKNFDLASFKRANTGMIATNDSTYKTVWGSRSLTTRIREYTLEEVEKIIQSGSLEEQQKLSRNYFYKDGLYKRLVIHYATLLKYVGILIPNPSFGKSLSTSHINKRYFNAVDFVDKLNFDNQHYLVQNIILMVYLCLFRCKTQKISVLLYLHLQCR